MPDTGQSTMPLAVVVKCEMQVEGGFLSSLYSVDKLKTSITMYTHTCLKHSRNGRRSASVDDDDDECFWIVTIDHSEDRPSITPSDLRV